MNTKQINNLGNSIIEKHYEKLFESINEAINHCTKFTIYQYQKTELRFEFNDLENIKFNEINDLEIIANFIKVLNEYNILNFYFKADDNFAIGKMLFSNEHECVMSVFFDLNNQIEKWLSGIITKKYKKYLNREVNYERQRN